MKHYSESRRFSRSKLAFSVATALSLTAGLSTFARAQNENVSISAEEITVTGSRIRRQDYNTGNPIATFDESELQNLGIVNAGDALEQMPSNVSRFTLANTGGNAFFVGSNLADLRGLNPYFGTRTLTLVDTRRHVATNQGGSVDLNFIPSVLIERMETVTGGASASYGADAVSGVVNIILNKELEGFKFDADYGVSGEGDGDNTHYAFGFGTEVADGRGHVSFGAEFQNQDVIQDCSTARDWCAKSTGLFTNGSEITDPVTFQGTGYIDPYIEGQPHHIVSNDLRIASSEHGLIFNPANLQKFNDDGTDVLAYDGGLGADRDPMATVVGGEGKSIYDNLTLMPENERQVFMLNGNWDFNENLTGTMEVSWGEVNAVNYQYAPNANSVTSCIKADNGFLLQNGSAAMQDAIADAEFADAMAGPSSNCATQGGGAPLVKDWNPETDQRVETDTTVQRIAFGLNGYFGNDWAWDSYYQFGKTERDQIAYDYRTNHRFTMAMDSIVENGEVICRAASSDPLTAEMALPYLADPLLAEGCAPLNPFGIDNSSDEALDYAFGSLTEYNEIEQQVLAVSTNGDLWQGWGHGPLSAAFGAEYRTEDFRNDAGDMPEYERIDFAQQYGNPFAGDLTATEVFAEFEMPVLAGLPGVENLVLNAAVRRAEYTIGSDIADDAEYGMTTWKFSTMWDITDDLTFRGSVSHDIRAPNYRELFYSQTLQDNILWAIFAPNPWLDDPNAIDTYTWAMHGNPELKPEEADTMTAGFVVRLDDWVEGLQFSADYYKIELENGIALGSPLNVLNACVDGDEAQCANITFATDGAGNPNDQDITRVDYYYGNANTYTSEGVDLAVNYMFPALGGDIAMRLMATHAISTIAPTGDAERPEIEIAGQTGVNTGFLADYSPSPDWNANFIVSYMRGPLTVTTQARFVSDGIMDLTTPKYGREDLGDDFDPTLVDSIESNRVPSHTVWNLNASYNILLDNGGNVQVWGNIDNLFDREPPYAGGGGTGGTNPMFFDAMGRMFRVGIRSQF